ncbi:hypothetical protein [Phytoactinopolyspora endophytica]|uniref:divisome protein SepX/GlpR n=1 Tax=Phytoactinopolyspora endophytica TaxID=1642495 RepID=UPI00101B6590|nr:hypothetical protein [Phytoactinopolyspora endophytica]
MGYSGLIYAAIVAAWLAVLVPRWVRRNEEVERARETDAAHGVRVLRRKSGPIHAPHHTVAGGIDARIIVAGDATGMATSRAASAGRVGATSGSDPAPESGSDGDAGRSGSRSELSAADPTLRQLEETFSRAASRRRRMLTILLVATVVGVAGTLLGPLPGWTPMLAGTMLCGFLVLARRAAVAQHQRRRAVRRRMAHQSAGPEHVADHETPVEVDDGTRIAVLDAPAEPEEPAGDTWEPVDVPLPTYVTKPKAPPRVARKIDLGQAGSWTSGRLENARSFDLPSRPPATPVARETSDADGDAADMSEEELPQKRRAVGE